MRIVGGTAGGRSIRAPRGQATRPTSDKVREAIFSILGSPPEGARVLDLYAGSGALGLEALSRGAESCVLVDRAAQAIRTALDNARTLGFEEQVRAVRGDVLSVLPRLVGPFHWIFVDPPYASDQAGATLSALGGPQAAVVAPHGVVVVEHDRRHVPDDRVDGLRRRDLRRYGDTEVSFFERSA
jgi:16S rRNA (guanine966-N2)-methyltransferase